MEKIGESYGISIVIINGAYWACDKDLSDKLEKYIYEKKRTEKRASKDA